MKKYELTDDTIEFNGKTLYRIKALRDFSDVKAGELGGYIENEYNLSHEGDAWVSGKARVFGNAKVFDNARVFGNAKVFDNAWVCNNARISDKAYIFGNACISSNACISGNARVCGEAQVFSNAHVCGTAQVCSNAFVHDNARVGSNAWISGTANIYGNACICTNAKISENEDYTVIQGFGTECRSTTFYRCVDDKVRVKCGCFLGTIDEFREQVKRTRRGKIAKEYLEIADLMERHFEKSLDDSDQLYIIDDSDQLYTIYFDPFEEV